MDILLVTAEIAPYSQGTIAAQHIASLAKSLRGLHHKVTVISPLYAGIDPTTRSLARRLSKVDVVLGADRFGCEIYDGRTTGGVDLTFIGEPKVFSGREQPLRADRASEARDAAVFCRAAAEVIRLRDPQPDVVHAIDAPAALVLAHIKAEAPSTKLLLSVHHNAADASIEGLDAADLAVPPATWSTCAREKTLLGAGAALADRVIVGSGVTADEWLASGRGVAGVLNREPAKLLVLAEGIDAALWNPLTDAALSSRFDPVDLSGKRHCKAQLQRQLQLPERADVPLVTVLGPLPSVDAWSGFLNDALRNDVQVAVVLKDGGEVGALEKLHERFPDRLAVVGQTPDAQLRQALGAADLLLMPAFAPPSEPWHRIGQRYGALPVVARTGTLLDTMVDCDPELNTGNGFLFEQDALLPTLQRALAAYARTQAFETLRVRVMRLDASWERSARLYEQAAQSRKLTN